MTLTETPQRPVISSIDEEFAVLLEEHDETARMEGEEVGGLIRKMLADKAIHEHIVRELEYGDDTDSEVDEE